MTEFFFIIFQFFIIYFILSFNILAIKKDKRYLYNFSFPENITFNSIIFLNIILFISFLNLNLNSIIFMYLAYCAFLIFIYFIRFKTPSILSLNYLFYFVLLFITSLIIFFELANNLVIGWDAQKFWIYKTLNFYNNNTITNLSNLTHPYYPYLGSLAWSFFWKISFLDHEYSGRFFYVFLYLCSLLLIIDNIKLSFLNKTVFFILLIIISYDYTVHSNWSMFSGYQEIIIFSLFTIAMHSLFKLSNANNKFKIFHLFSILLICNLLLWIKHEGIILSTSLILTVILFLKLNIKNKFLIFLSFLVIIFFRFFIFEFYDLNPGNIQHEGFELLSLENNFDKISIDRFVIVLISFFKNFFTNYLVLLGSTLLVLLVISNKNLKRMNYIFFIAIFNFFCFFTIYLMTDLDISFMVKTWDRIIYQFSPVAFLIFLEYFKSNNYFKKN